MVDDEIHTQNTEILNSILEEWIGHHDNEYILSIYNLQLQRLPSFPEGVKYIQLCGLDIDEPFEFPDSLIAIEMRYVKSPRCQTLPPNLLEFKLLHCNWKMLPPLPLSLQRLSIHYSKIKTFPEVLPPKLKYLYCSNLDISHIPSLPKTLKALELMKLPVKVPPILPENIEYLDIGYTNIEELPSDYWSNHKKLHIIYCNSMRNLVSLPSLPPSLECLDCHETPISYLPSLPPTLKELYCARTSINRLPDIPKSMNTLSVYDNFNLRSLPSLPESLLELYVDYTSITYLQLPPSLKDLDCEHCPNLLLPRAEKQTITAYRKSWETHIQNLTIHVCHQIKEELMMRIWSPENLDANPWLLFTI